MVTTSFATFFGITCFPADAESNFKNVTGRETPPLAKIEYACANCNALTAIPYHMPMLQYHFYTTNHGKPSDRPIHLEIHCPCVDQIPFVAINRKIFAVAEIIKFLQRPHYSILLKFCVNR